MPDAAVSVSAASATSAPATVAPADVATVAADIDNLPPPTVQATAAVKSVTTANYKTELDSVEKELNGIK
jgi:hypothetical protein